MTTLLLTAKCSSCGGDVRGACRTIGGKCGLCFLRSGDPAPRRAASNGRRRLHARNQPLHDTTPQRRPPTAIELAIERRPPRAAERRRAATRAANEAARQARDYGSAYRLSERAEELERVEARVIGWLVCRSLGDAWRWEADGEGARRVHRMVHDVSGAVLNWSRSWNDSKRYSISPENLYRAEGIPSSITVSAERTPADIARDVERRLVGAGLFDHPKKLLAAASQRRRADVAERLQCLAVARAYGGQLRREHGSQSRPAATTEHFGPATEGRGYQGKETDIVASIDYYGVKLEIGTANTELAIKIAELVSSHYAEA